MGRSIGVLATRYLWAGIVDGVQLGDVKVYPDPAQPQIDLKTVPAPDIFQFPRSSCSTQDISRRQVSASISTSRSQRANHASSESSSSGSANLEIPQASPNRSSEIGTHDVMSTIARVRSPLRHTNQEPRSLIRPATNRQPAAGS